MKNSYWHQRNSETYKDILKKGYYTKSENGNQMDNFLDR